MSGLIGLSAYGSDVESDEEEQKTQSPIEKELSSVENMDVGETEECEHNSPKTPQEDVETTYNISDTELDNIMDESEIKGVEDMSTLNQTQEESEEENLEDSKDLDTTERLKRAAKRQKRMSSENATAFSKKIRTASLDEITLPPEPEGKCSKLLQDKIANLHKKKQQDNYNLNDYFQTRKDFRNPSIYDKLILYLGIEELGTNFSPEDYNPNEYKKYPAYDELARTQREDIARKEKEKKAKDRKIEYVTANASKVQTSSDASRKSKWDQQIRSSSVTGTSSTTVIPAMGSLKKSK